MSSEHVFTNTVFFPLIDYFHYPRAQRHDVVTPITSLQARGWNSPNLLFKIDLGPFHSANLATAGRGAYAEF